jgi:redox-sensing transcriptional repressor
MHGSSKAPIPTLARLATYFRILDEAQNSGQKYISSAKIEAETGISAAQVRKDLSHFGEMGKPGVGYDVGLLRAHFQKILNLDRTQRVVVIGAGRLGQALASYQALAEFGFQVVGIFDSDKRKFGAKAGGHEVQDAAKMPSLLPKLKARMAILTVPSSVAQKAAEAAFAGGIRRFLNFTPAHIQAPPGCLVRDVSFMQEFAVLAHFTED